MSHRTVAPIPYPGGKTMLGPTVWQYFASVNSYIEPFFGSGAVFFARPKKLRFETINDADGLVVNFWRAVRKDPDRVAACCDRIRSEIELVVAGRWLSSLNLSDKLKEDPSLCSPEVAGIWAWYMSCTIGARVVTGDKQQPRMLRQGVLGDARRETLEADLRQIAESLRDVRILCGDWKACLGPANHQDQWKTDPIGVFLDPPYKGFEFYNEGQKGVSEKARAWALEHGDDPAYRIALCGYAGEHNMPGWLEVPWKTVGRVSNKHQEVLWVSPSCDQ